MTNIQVEIILRDPDLDNQELQSEVQNLVQHLLEDVEVEHADLVPVETAPEDSKSLGGFLLGVLTAEVNAKNFKKLMTFLTTRLSGQAIEMEVQANGKQIRVKANNLDELREIIKIAQNFVDAEGEVCG